MQSRLAYKLLFDESGPDGKPLFGTLGDLSQALSKIRPNSKTKGLSAFLSQILNQGHRSCPDSLIKDIEKAVFNRLTDLPAETRGEWVTRVRLALEADNKSRGSGEPLSAEALYGELIYLAETAEEQFIITALPAERVLSKRAEVLREILLRRLHIVEAECRRTINARYTFCLPSTADCLRWWDSLVSEARSTARQRGVPFDQSNLSEYLAQLDTNDYLRLFAVPPFVCGSPVVVFNPDSSDPNGFNLYYFSDPIRQEYLVSVSKMDPEYLQQWKYLVHSALENERVQISRVRYTDLLKPQNP